MSIRSPGRTGRPGNYSPLASPSLPGRYGGTGRFGKAPPTSHYAERVNIGPYGLEPGTLNLVGPLALMTGEC
jgi:hypothetical protein